MERLRRLIQKVKQTMGKIQYELSHESCYDKMEADGVAVNGNCCGVVGGGKTTDYTAEFCLDCPYYSPANSQEGYPTEQERH